MRSRYLILTGLLAIIVCLTFGVLALLPPRPGVTKANFDRIEIGMTCAEVDAIFGEPAWRRFRIRSDGIIHDDQWRNPDGSGANISSQDNIVSGMLWTDSVESIPEKLRRWLRW